MDALMMDGWEERRREGGLYSWAEPEGTRVTARGVGCGGDRVGTRVASGGGQQPGNPAHVGPGDRSWRARPWPCGVASSVRRPRPRPRPRPAMRRASRRLGSARDLLLDGRWARPGFLFLPLTMALCLLVRCMPLLDRSIAFSPLGRGVYLVPPGEHGTCSGAVPLEWCTAERSRAELADPPSM